jgi:hypothetical protein
MIISYSLRTTLPVLLVICVAATSVSAQRGPFRAGSYRCSTTSSVPTAATDPRDPNWRKANGLPALQQGERAVTPNEVAPILSQPAFFGDIVVSQSGNYTLSRSGKTGTVRFDRTTARPVFTGDLNLMRVAEYNAQQSAFTLVYKSLAWECSLDTPNASRATTAAPLAGATPPPLRTPAPDATMFTGTFVGTYECHRKYALQLELRAEPNGNLTATFIGGGTNGDAREQYTMAGHWSGRSFALEPREALARGSNTVMTPLSGQLDGQRLYGQVVHPQCGRFEVARP